MSTDARSRSIELDTDRAIGPTLFRLLALGCVLALTASYVSVLHDVTRVVGGTETLFALVAAMVLVATLLARAIRPRTATAGAIAAAAIGFGYYLSITGIGVGAALSAGDELFADTVALATGLPLLRMVAADVWTFGFVPGPVFLSWYLAVRGRYDLSVVPGGLALLFLVLTGDAGTTVTLSGTLAAMGAVGFGELEHRGGSVAQAELFAVLVAVIVVLSLSVTFVPGESTSPMSPSQSDTETLEGTIDVAGDRSSIGGQVDLSPEVRFTVSSAEQSYWRTGIYDRFTGDEWIRTGQDTRYEERLAPPPGEYDIVRQQVTAETDLGVLPTAPQPLAIEPPLDRNTVVSSHGQLRPSAPLRADDSYIVESAVIEPSPNELQIAGTAYPDHIAGSEYLQTPESTSDAFAERTAEITADADTPYEKAAAIETYLRSSKEYSLEVDRPDGNVAEEFLFEMDAGYCVYFATTMVQMLRTEEVPTRYVTGYTSGQQVDDNTHVVRGLDAHAWVEVYFPDHGWVAFEPTPGDARNDVHTDRLQEARDDGRDDVDTDQSEDVPLTDEDDTDTGTDESGPDDQEPDAHDETDDETAAAFDDNGTESPENESSDRSGDDSTDLSPDDGSDDGDLPEEGWSSPITITRELATIGLVVLVGVAAGAHRTSAMARLRGAVGLYWQGRRDDPDEATRVAYRRLEQHLSRKYRPRRRSESRRGYLVALRTDHEIDSRTMQVVQAYEQATYGEGVDRETADATIAIVDELVRDRLPLVGDR